MITMRRFFALLLGAIVAIGLHAEPITREQARQKAIDYLKRNNVAHQLAPVSNRARLAPRRSKSASDDLDLYYVFSRGEGEGFIIMSGDDRTVPVIGYTDNGDFDYNELNPNMRHWLDSRESELLELSTRTSDKTIQRAPAIHDAIAKMVTTTWNQGWPYNNDCPNYFDKGRSVTGCVATAMAQVLYYQRAKSVKETQADMPGYNGWTDYNGKYLAVEGIPAGSPIDWDNMLNSYSSSATAKQQNAVAQLMHYCGVSVYMDYTNSSSGAQSSNVPEAFQKYFGYGSKTRIIYQSSYSEDNWDKILYNELAQGRPFYLSGYNVDSSGQWNGHAFVCDGYDGAGCFHINWGWGGNSDGWYVLTKLNPGSQGIGGSAGGYSTEENAVIGCEPENYGTHPMPFAKSNVKKLCVAAWDTDSDEELSFDEAASVTNLGTVFKGQKIVEFNELYYFTGLTNIPDSAFMGCTSLVGIKLPKSVKTIGRCAFAKNAKMKLTLHDGIMSIGDSAFAGCKVMANQTLPINLTRIENNTFEGCQAFKQITISNTIKYIGRQAFKGCTKLETVNLKSIAPQSIVMGDEVFAGITLSAATLNTEQGFGNYLRTAPQWSDFGTIYEERTLSGGQFATTIETKKPYYIYNVAAGMYLSKGEAWGTQAIVEETDQPMRFEFRNTTSMPDGVYYLYSPDTGKDGHIMFRTSGDNTIGKGVKACFVDGGTSHNSDKTSYWKLAKVEGSDNVFTLQIPSGQDEYNASQFLGVVPSHDSNASSPTYGAYYDIDYDTYSQNCQWVLVPYDEDETLRYQTSLQLKNLLALGKSKRADIELEQMVYEDFNSSAEEMQKACRKLRKKLNFINFADDEVRRIATSVFDDNKDGEVSYTEAASVDEIDLQFATNTKITEFTELQYFTKANYTTGNSFKGCTNLRRVVLPPNAYGIFYQSFQNDTKLEYVEVGNKITTIGSSAFRNCKALKEFRISVSDPSTITLADSIFYNTPVANATLYVPYGSKALYENAAVWKKFGTIKEMRAVGTPRYTPLTVGERVYIYNYNTGEYLNKGEAYGTQAITYAQPMVFQVMHDENMPESIYYLKSASGIMFRTSKDSKIGVGVKGCFIDGATSRITDKTALWKIMPVQGKENVYTFQVPETDAEYVEGEYLGTDLEHASDAKAYFTHGAYYDVTGSIIQSQREWSFIGLDEIEADETIYAQSEELKQLIDKAVAKGFDVTEEQAVYDDFSSTLQQINDAIASIREKLHYIVFADAKAKSISIGRWDDDEDGEISMEEAAAVTNISTAFNAASGLKSFEELRYFTSLTTIPDNAFSTCTALHTIYLPKNITNIGQKAFYNCSALKFIAIPEGNSVIEAATANLPSSFSVFVPEQMLESYTADASWGKNGVTVSAYTGIPCVETQPASRIYGRANPNFTYLVKGAPINGTPTFTTEVNEKTPVGDYPVIAQRGTITNDTVTLKNSTITIERAPFTMTARSYTRNVGEENPTFEYYNSILRNGEKLEDILLEAPVLECDATIDSPAGEYEIRISGAVTKNYDITYVNGKLTVVDPTGIRNVKTDDAGNATYNLSGQKLNGKPSQKGIYIKNRRKLVIKQ